MIFIPSKDTNLEWAEKYTRSSYKSKSEEEIEKSLYNWYLRQLNKYGNLIISQFGEPKTLSFEDSLKFLKCYTCDKVFMNNARSYCQPCEYYSSEF